MADFPTNGSNGDAERHPVPVGGYPVASPLAGRPVPYVEAAPAPDFGQTNIGLSEILRMLRRRWLWIIVPILLGVLAAEGYAWWQTPSYSAKSRVLIRTVVSDTAVQIDPNARIAAFADRQLQNQLLVLQSTSLRAAVAQQYHGKIDVNHVHADAAVTGSDAIDITVNGSDPQDAADLVNIYAKTYISSSEKARSDALEAGATAIQKRIDDLTAQKAAIEQPLNDVTAQLAAEPNNTGLLNQAKQLQTQIAPQVTDIDSELQLYQSRLQNLQLNVDIAQSDAAEVVTEATPHGSPDSPRPVLYGILGAVFGLGLGIALALAREFLDESVRTPDDLELAVHGAIPVLGSIPRYPNSDKDIVTVVEPASLAAESYRALRTAVRFAAVDRDRKVILVTSPKAGDGKTCTVANLAAALVQAGNRVAVVSCDLRRPRIHERFDEPRSPGLTDVLLGESDLAAAIRQTSSGVYLLAAGSRPPNPSELLGSPRTEVVIDFLKSKFDFVLLDSTPALSVTDAVVVSRFAEATILVVGARETNRRRVRDALNALALANAPVIGMVLNKVSTGGRDRYDYVYADEKYVADDAKSRKSKKSKVDA